MRQQKIVMRGCASYVPEKVIPNQFFNDMLQEDVDTWLKTNLTIQNRRWCSETESTADLCVHAVNSLVDKCAISMNQIDLLIVATDTPEFISPATATVVQHRLGATKAACFDINNACAGFVTAMETACKFLLADPNYQHAVVVGAYAMSKYLDLKDKKTVTLFADGAGAILLSRVPRESDGGLHRGEPPLASESHGGYVGGMLHTRGQYNRWMGIYGGGTHLPSTAESIARGDHKIRFVQRFPPELNPAIWSEMIPTLLAQHGLAPNDVKLFLFTQININSIRETMALLAQPMEKTHCIMSEYGYTGSACLPMALDSAIQAGKVKSGDLVVLMGSGGGLSFGVSAIYV